MSTNKAVNQARPTPMLIGELKEQPQPEGLKARAARAKATQPEATLYTSPARLQRLEAATRGQAQR